jgi:hypothetical protein
MNQDVNNTFNTTPPDSPDELSFLDTEQNIVEPIHSMQTNYRKGTSTIQRKTLLAGIIPSLIAILLVASFIGWRIMTSQNSNDDVQNNTNPSTSVDLSGVKLSVDNLSSADELLINGDLVVNSTLVLSPQDEPANPQTGQIYYDSTEQVARVYDGASFRRLLASETNDNVCFVNGDCGFSSTGTVNVLNTRIATAETTIARLVTQQPSATATDLSGINSSISQLQSQVAAIPPTPSLASYFQNGGNNFSTTATLGTSTSNDLSLLTNNQTRATITGSGNLVVDTNTLFVDATNNRVGVGTSTPTGTFEVLGNSVLGGTTTTGDLIPLTPGSTTLGFVENDVLTINNQSSVYNDSQKFIAMGLDDLPRFVYFDNSYQDVHYVRCLDEDCQTFNDTIISSNPDDQDAPTIRIGSDGFARIVYTNWSDPQEIHYVQCLDDDCSSRNDNIIDSQSSYPFYEISFALDANDNAQIVYNNYVTDEVSFAQCTNADCSSVNLTAVTGFGYGSTYGIEVGQDGFARIAYYDNNEIVFIKCNNQDCSSNNVQIAATGLASASNYVDLVLDTNDLGRIAYSDRDGTGLKLITCLDDICSSSSSIIVDAAAINVQLSLNIDSNDRARVAYQNIPYRTGLRYAYCNNSACSSVTITDIDTVGGYPLSLTTGSDDLSTIFHRGVDDAVIKIAKLNTENGQNSSVYGTSIGSSTAYFGQGYMQGLSIQAASTGSVLSLDNINLSGELIEFNLAGIKKGSLGATEDSIEFRNNDGIVVLGVNTATPAVNIAGNLNLSEGDLNINNGNLNLNGNAVITNTLDSASAFNIQDSSGLSLFNVNSLERSITIGSPEDSNENAIIEISSTGDTLNIYGSNIHLVDFNKDGVDEILVQNGIYSKNDSGIYVLSRFNLSLNNSYGGSFNKTADFNNDGYEDVALHLFSGSTQNLAILINDTYGGFQNPVYYDSSSYSFKNPTSWGGASGSSIDYGDFNNDGYVDIITTNYNASNFSVFMNNGDGTFAPRVDYATGSWPSSFSTDDFNLDGYDDLVLNNGGSHNIFVYMNNGDGTFAPRVSYPLGSSSFPQDVDSGDLNGDGYPDIVSNRSNFGQVSVFINNGNGTFAPQVIYQTDWATNGIQLIDENYDGLLDIIVMHFSAKKTTILRNNGDGTFSIYKKLDTKGANYIYVSDRDNNGISEYTFTTDNKLYETEVSRLKVIEPPTIRLYSSGNDVLQAEGTGNKQVFRVDGQGSTTIGGSVSVQSLFNSPSFYPAGDYAESVYSVDINSDNIVDIAFTSRIPGILSIFIGSGDGTFAPRVNYPTGTNPSETKGADLDNDGDIDLITNGGSAFSVFINNGDGTFMPRVNYALGANFYSYFEITDLNGDGYQDVVRSSYISGVATVSVFINNGNGTFAPSINYSTTNSIPRALHVEDMNGNGSMDVIIQGDNSSTTFFNDGNGVFTQNQVFTTSVGPNNKGIIFSDFNSDGLSDIANFNNQDLLTIFLNDGNGNFIQSSQVSFNDIITSGSLFTTINYKANDIDNDGTIEIVVQGTRSVSSVSTNYLVVLENDGNGSFSYDSEYLISDPITTLSIEDINNDTYPDIVLLNVDVIVKTLKNDKTGKFYDEVIYKIGNKPRFVLVEDLNKDGVRDMIIVDGGISFNGMYVLLGKGESLVNENNRLSVFNLDGDKKIFSINQTGNISIQNSVDSTTALQVQNVAGASIFNVDTQNSSVRISTPTNSTTALNVVNSGASSVLSVDTLNSGVIARSPTNNALAFQVQNSAGTAVLSVNTLNLRVDIASGADIKLAGSGNVRNAITKDFVCTVTEAVNDVVVINGVATVGRTTTAASNRVAGVVVEKPNSTTCTVAVAGMVQVNFGANANPVTIGDPVETSAIAGMAQATTTPSVGAVLGNTTSNKDGSNLVWILMRGN